MFVFSIFSMAVIEYHFGRLSINISVFKSINKIIVLKR